MLVSAQKLEEEANRKVHRLSPLNVLNCLLHEWVSHARIVSRASNKNVNQSAQSEFFRSVAGARVGILGYVPEYVEVEELHILDFIDSLSS